MKQKDEKKALEDMLYNANGNLENNVPKGNETPELDMDPLFDNDLDEMRNDCNKQAKRMIQTSTGFMLSNEIIRDNPYLRDKMKIDIESLSGMLYQIRSSELMQKTLMEQVRSGAAHPRNFEVYSQLTKAISELNKQLLQTVEAIKVTYRDVKQDVRDKEQELKALGETSSNGLVKNSNGIISLGTKDLIKSVKLRHQQLNAAKISENSNIIDVKPIE